MWGVLLAIQVHCRTATGTFEIPLQIFRISLFLNLRFFKILIGIAFFMNVWFSFWFESPFWNVSTFSKSYVPSDSKFAFGIFFSKFSHLLIRFSMNDFPPTLKYHYSKVLNLMWHHQKQEKISFRTTWLDAPDWEWSLSVGQSSIVFRTMIAYS